MKCNTERPISKFPKSPRMSGGHANTCNECQNKRNRELRAERQGITPEELASRVERQSNTRLRKKANAVLETGGQRMCSRCREVKPLSSEVFVLHRRNKEECGSICRKCQSDLCKEHYGSNKESYHSRARAFEKAHPEWQSARNRKYRTENSEKIALRLKNRRRDDPLYKTERLIRASIAGAFRRKGFTKRSRVTTILGCNWMELQAHFERQFLKGMSWDNRDKWHIDHIVPVATAKNEDDLIALNHFTNLRPLWATDNHIKSAKITHLI